MDSLINQPKIDLSQVPRVFPAMTGWYWCGVDPSSVVLGTKTASDKWFYSFLLKCASRDWSTYKPEELPDMSVYSSKSGWINYYFLGMKDDTAVIASEQECKENNFNPSNRKTGLVGWKPIKFSTWVDFPLIVPDDEFSEREGFLNYMELYIEASSVNIKRESYR